MRKTLFGATLFALCGLCSCVTDINWNEVSHDVGYNAALVIPVGTARTGVGQLINVINSDMVRLDSANNTIVLWASDTIKINTGEIKLSDFSHSLVSNSSMTPTTKLDLGTVPASGKVLAAGSHSFTDENSEIDFDFNHTNANGDIDQRIDSIRVTSASLQVKVKTDKLTFGGGNKLLIDIRFTGSDLPARHYQIQQQSWENDETVYNFKVAFSGNDTKVGVVTTYTIVSDGTARLYNDSKINLSTQFQLIDYETVWGYFGRDEVITHDNIVQQLPTHGLTSGVFSKEGNKLLFSDPQIRFDVISNIGFPMDFRVNYIKARDKDGNEVQAEFMENGAPTDWCIIPLRKPAALGDTSVNTRIFTSADGHTEKLFEILPFEFDYQFEVRRQVLTSPAGSWDWQHYLTKPLTLEMHILSEMPFQFNPKTQYEYGDTLDCDIESLTGMNGFPNELSIEQLNLDFLYENKLPVKAVCQAVMLDADNNELFASQEVEMAAAPTNAEGRTIGSTDDEFRFEFNGDNIDQIWKAKKAVFRVRVTAQEMDKQKIYFSIDDYLEAKVTLFVKGRIETNLDTVGQIFN